MIIFKKSIIFIISKIKKSLIIFNIFIISKIKKSLIIYYKKMPFKYIMAGTITGLVIKRSIDSYKAYNYFSKNIFDKNIIIKDKFSMYRCEISTSYFIASLFGPFDLLSKIVGMPTLMLIHSFKYSIGYYKQHKSLVESFELLEVSMMEITKCISNHTDEVLTM